MRRLVRAVKTGVRLTPGAHAAPHIFRLGGECISCLPISSRRQWPPENTTGRSSRSQPHRNRAHLVVATTSASASADRPSPAAMKRVCIPRAKHPCSRKNKNIHLIPVHHAVNAVRIRCRRECQAGKPPQSALRMLPDARRRDASLSSAHGPVKFGGASGPARRVGRRVETRQPGHASTGLHFHWLAARHLGIVCV